VATLREQLRTQQMPRLRLELSVHHKGNSLLVNTYAVLQASNDADAAQFARWLTTGAGRTLIASFSVDGQRQYSVWPEGCAASLPSDTPCDLK
jgi:ABC-type tungstate transport system permease subunit